MGQQFRVQRTVSIYATYLQVQACGDDGQNSPRKTTALLKELRYDDFELRNFVLRPALCSTVTKQRNDSAVDRIGPRRTLSQIHPF